MLNFENDTENQMSILAVLYKLSNFLFQMSWVTDLLTLSLDTTSFANGCWSTSELVFTVIGEGREYNTLAAFIWHTVLRGTT